MRNSEVAARTVTGPVGKLDIVPLMSVPVTPDRAPKIPARMTIMPNESVQYRAATAGVMSNAATRTTPTA
ncbi:hypothetical protein D3C78_1746860 [compost metagenome]